MNREEVLHPIRIPRRVRLRTWLIAVLFFGIGDVATTSVGLGVDGIYEAGPLVAPLIQRYGLVAMVALKLVVFTICYLLWRFTPRPYCAGVPLGLAMLGVSVTVWNLHLLTFAILTY